MKAFLRENLMIVVSIALPLLVAIFFALATGLPGFFATPPEHDLLLSLNGRSAARNARLNVRFLVENNQIRVVASKQEDPYPQNIPRLFRYDHLDHRVTEIPIPVPEDISGFEQETEIPVPELERLIVTDTLVAPDGYEYRGRRSGGGLITELFGASRNRTDVSIAKNGAIKRLRIPAPEYSYYDISFVAWVIDGGS